MVQARWRLEQRGGTERLGNKRRGAGEGQSAGGREGGTRC